MSVVTPHGYDRWHKDLRIYEFVAGIPVDTKIVPRDLDYKMGLKTALAPDRQITRGELLRVDWYRDYDPETGVFGHKVLQVDIVYTRDIAGFPIYRTTTRHWIDVDGDLATPAKLTKKWYIGIERDRETTTRRRNIISTIKSAVGKHLVMEAYIEAAPSDPTAAAVEAKLDLARTFQDGYRDHIEKFVEMNTKDLYYGVQADSTSWLDDDLFHDPANPTLRAFILNEMLIWSIAP